MKEFFVIEDKIVKLSKDCKVCDKVSVCKFHAKMKELCQTNEFYEMTEYAEWNNSLQAFEKYASCRYFKLNFKIADNDEVNLETHREILKEIIKMEIKKANYDYGSYHINVNENRVILSKYKEEDVELKITDLIAGYKFPPKK